jgi:outer membrane protein TolC
MKARILVRLAVIGVGVVSVVSCTLGPEPERPTTAAEVSDTWVHAPEIETTPLPEVAPWWREFGDETTTELVELALANNPGDSTSIVRAAKYRSPTDHVHDLRL